MSASIPSPSVKASSRTTFGAIVAAGFDPDKIIGGFNASPSGAALIEKLYSDSDGIDWSDELTRFVVGRIVAAGGDVTADVAALLVGLSARTTTLAGGVVAADQCRADWVAGFEAEETQTKRDDWRQRFDAALNTLGTLEQAAGIADVRRIADEMEPAE